MYYRAHLAKWHLNICKIASCDKVKIYAMQNSVPTWQFMGEKYQKFKREKTKRQNSLGQTSSSRYGDLFRHEF